MTSTKEEIKGMKGNRKKKIVNEEKRRVERDMKVKQEGGGKGKYRRILQLKGKEVLAWKLKQGGEEKEKEEAQIEQ